MAPRKKDNITKRLSKVMIYKKLSESSLTNLSDEDGKEVEAEIQAFVNTRIQVLMGIIPDPTSDREKSLDSRLTEIYDAVKSIKVSDFNETEKVALSKLAEMVLKPKDETKVEVKPVVQAYTGPATVSSGAVEMASLSEPIVPNPELPIPGMVKRPPGLIGRKQANQYEMEAMASQQTQSLANLNDAIVRGNDFNKQ